MNKLLKRLNGDTLAANVITNKYLNGKEQSLEDLFYRINSKIAPIFIKRYKALYSSKFLINFKGSSDKLNDFLFSMFNDMKILPQGSILANLGTDKIASLSNCFVVPQPSDSYGGILYTDQHLANLMKRRGGVGTDLSKLRFKSAPVTNAAKTSSGAVEFAKRLSNTTNEVAQDGRRGALMLSMHINHIDVLEFIESKLDKVSISGANISVKITNEFADKVINNEDHILRFPYDADVSNIDTSSHKYGEIVENEGGIYTRKVKASELYDKIAKAAWECADPGQLFEDLHHDNSPDSVYKEFKGLTTNPCFHPDTLIETEYGRIKIKDIDKPMRVYSMDSDGKLVMSDASPSFISKRNAKTLKITLKSGSSIQVTPEHIIYVQE